jgi:heptosyltransferase-2
MRQTAKSAVVDPVAAPDRRTLVHQVRYYWDLLKPSGPRAIPLHRNSRFPEEEQAMAGRFAQGGLPATDIVVGINPVRPTAGLNVGCAERFASEVTRTILPHDSRIS